MKPLVLLIGSFVCLAGIGYAEEVDDYFINAISPAVEPVHSLKMTILPENAIAPHFMGVGVAYTGAQARLNLSPRWSMEARFQSGKANSNEGKVTAGVGSVRAYRFRHPEQHMPFYWGAELGYSKATSQMGVYKTSGPVAGGFGGFEYRMGRRMAVDFDIGPYVTALKENQTNVSQTNLDFVVNTALMVFAF